MGLTCFFSSYPLSPLLSSSTDEEVSSSTMDDFPLLSASTLAPVVALAAMVGAEEGGKDVGVDAVIRALFCASLRAFLSFSASTVIAPTMTTILLMFTSHFQISCISVVTIMLMHEEVILGSTCQNYDCWNLSYLSTDALKELGSNSPKSVISAENA